MVRYQDVWCPFTKVKHTKNKQNPSQRDKDVTRVFTSVEFDYMNVAP